jgi:hypothetical protein
MAYQVSIFLENKVGHLEKVTRILREASINIRAMNLTHTTQGWGILNLLVSDPIKAKETLTGQNVSASLRKIAVIAMDDVPGGLDELLKTIALAGINFTNAYGRNTQPGRVAYLAIDVEDIENAFDKISSAGLQLIPDDEVYGNGNS